MAYGLIIGGAHTRFALIAALYSVKSAGVDHFRHIVPFGHIGIPNAQAESTDVSAEALPSITASFLRPITELWTRSGWPTPRWRLAFLILVRGAGAMSIDYILSPHDSVRMRTTIDSWSPKNSESKEAFGVHHEEPTRKA